MHFAGKKNRNPIQNNKSDRYFQDRSNKETAIAIKNELIPSYRFQQRTYL